MNIENKQKLIDFINARTTPWRCWSYAECFVGMMQKIAPAEYEFGLTEFLGITETQRDNLVYMTQRKNGDPIENLFGSKFTRMMGLETQKEVLIGALNSISDDNSYVTWDERLR